MKKNILLLILASNLALAQIPTQFYHDAPASGINFGRIVEVCNNEILVSSSSSWFFGELSTIGKVYLFSNSDGGIIQTKVFYPDEALANDFFGFSIAINNDFIAIGSPDRDNANQNSGAVYVYHKTNGQYEFLQKIIVADGAANNHFGCGVKIHNNQLFIASGQPVYGDNTNDISGMVSVYNYNGTEWVFSENLTVPGYVLFGYKIETGDNKMVISSNGSEDYSTTLHTFNLNGTHWELENSLTIGNYQSFLKDFSFSGSHIYYVSGPMHESGSVSTLSQINGNWELTDNFSLPVSDQVYGRIKSDGEKMLIGSTSYVLQVVRKFPVLYYLKEGDDWTYNTTFYGTDPAVWDDYFGESLAMHGNHMVIGAPNEGPEQFHGRAYYIDAALNTTGFGKKSGCLYPNPTPDKVYIENHSGNIITQTRVYSMTGNLLLTENKNTSEISLEKLARGIYFIKLKYADASEETFKIIKS